MTRILAFFIRGLIFLVPILGTIWLGYYLYSLLTVYGFTDQPWLNISIILVGITLIGWLLSSIFARPVIMALEEILTNVPFVKVVYSSIKDMMEAFMGEKKRFNKPVLIHYPGEGSLQRIGFITQEDLSQFGLMDRVAVYVPMSYSFSGNLFLVPVKDITPLKGFDTTELMKFVVAGGVTDLDELLEKEEEKEEKVENTGS